MALPCSDRTQPHKVEIGISLNADPRSSLSHDQKNFTIDSVNAVHLSSIGPQEEVIVMMKPYETAWQTEHSKRNL